MLDYKQLVYNPLQVNTWVVFSETGECFVIDPSCSQPAEKADLKNQLSTLGYNPLAVLATHGHFDHVPGVRYTTGEYACQFFGHQADQALMDFAPQQAEPFGFDFGGPAPVIDRALQDKEILKLGSDEIICLHVPGHSAGSLAYYAPKANFVVVGDVLFKGSIGRTDLPGGDYDTLISSIKESLLCLPDDTIVLPGHGPATTIGEERRSNPFLVQ